MKLMRKTTYTLLIAVVLIMAACRDKAPETTPHTDTIPMLIMQIQKCSRLYTAECRLHKIITHDDKVSLRGKFMSQDYDIGLPLGNRKIAIPIDATVKAYIDFADFAADNIRREGDKIELILPDPKVALTSTTIDHKGMKQFVALTRSNFSDEEIASYEQQGRQAIIGDIPKLNITDMARESAANILIPMLRQAGFKEENITVTFRKDFNKNNITPILVTGTDNGKKK